MQSAICSNIEHTVSIGSTVGSSGWPEHAWLLTSVRLQGVIRHCRGPLHLPPHLHNLGITRDTSHLYHVKHCLVIGDQQVGHNQKEWLAISCASIKGYSSYMNVLFVYQL